MTNDEKQNSAKQRKMKKILAYGLPIALLIIAVVLFVMFWGIYSTVKSVCQTAQAEFGGDCVEALLSYIESDNHSFKDKNHAIWAIGQFGDKRAIPVLEKLYTGQPCEKPCRTEKYICQYGLEKAIKFSKSGGLFTPIIRSFLLTKQEKA